MRFANDPPSIVQMNFVRGMAGLDPLPRFDEWSRKLEVERAVREGLRRAGVTAREAERAIRLVGEEAAVIGHIRQAWREAHA